MSSVLQSFQAGFPVFLIWTGTAGALFILAATIYVLLTPWKELALVRGGNATAGLALAGAFIGLAIPLASCLASSVSLLDLILWGVVALILQLLAYRLTDLLLRDLPKRIQDDEAGAAIVLISTKLASAMLLAAGLWDPALQRF
ncbi:DUF350 domain-containing protein [Henriciella mobilis]|uniref:DUF350 domain-containing protein n=1 Tax=Henriciella mobilis TaxID=2305467 RepID=A0A399RFR8_9PROT|nr:DUF350 domain-containing protein [Henriciella mobilis]RIJ18036.1 DUF350 domain-containing protein [Henriciella mobilis]RIJ25155.1 DUF350 domain-containing protein [Henriciella mobilis]RIJ30218.1 DUF350 domain-containing protein [Henriciella mobilis]